MDETARVITYSVDGLYDRCSKINFEFDDFLYLGFHLRADRPVGLVDIGAVTLQQFSDDEVIARYNVNFTKGGGKFSLVHGHSYRRHFANRWISAYQFVDIPSRSPVSQLGATDELKTAWLHVRKSLPFARRLQ